VPFAKDGLIICCCCCFHHSGKRRVKKHAFSTFKNQKQKQQKTGGRWQAQGPQAEDMEDPMPDGGGPAVHRDPRLFRFPVSPRPQAELADRPTIAPFCSKK
jgi:hypothetical protein